MKRPENIWKKEGNTRTFIHHPIIDNQLPGAIILKKRRGDYGPESN